MLKTCKLLLWQMAVGLSYQVVTASLCLSGSDIFASIRENSPSGEFVSDIGINSDPGGGAIRLCLTGPNADWFYLDGRSIRLNSSASRVLDREVQGPVLVAQLTCFENDIIQSHFRILVEILNQNDNKPNFLQETIQPVSISELTGTDSIVFTVKALDADGDLIRYSIDPSSDDAWFFRIDLPNSGNVVLNKPLDYETRTRLKIVMWAQESNTEEKFNTSAVLTINIQDGDDQYPHFLPCTPVSPGVPVCMNPTYMANITHKHQDLVLDFSPGPIRAEDGDRGINSSLIYSILSGNDQNRFMINNRTGEIHLTRAVDDRRVPANFSLSIMVCQVDDRLKYSVASVLVRILCENKFSPVFNRTTFKGFIIQSSSPASIVSTYGNQVLQVQVSDRDFSDGVNPNIRYFLHPASQLYQVTQDGVLIARTDQLRAFDRNVLQVVARDEESGEEVSASVDIEVLQRGQTVPRGAFTEQQMFGEVDTRLAGGLAVMILLMFLSVVLVILLRVVQRKRVEEPDQEKHPDVVNSSPTVLMKESSYHSRAFKHQSSSRSGSFHGREGVYTRRQSLPLAPSSSSSSSSSNIPSDSGSRTFLLPPSDVSLSNPARRCRFQTDLFVVTEKAEGAVCTWETNKPPEVTAGDDITVQPQRES